MSQLQNDAKVALTAECTDMLGRPAPPPTMPAWASDNTEIATVDASGATVFLVPVANGTCKITATSGLLTDTIVVEVVEPAAVRLKISVGVPIAK